MHSRVSINLFAIVVALAGLAACGSGTSGNSDNTGSSEPAPPPVSDSVTINAAELPMGDWLARGFKYADRDGDGIEDAHDPWPDERPVIGRAQGRPSLLIDRAWTEVDGKEIAGTAIEGQPLLLEVSGLPAGGAAPWVVFQTPQGLRAARADLVGTRIISVEPVAAAMGAHIVAGAWRGTNIPLRGLALGQPLLFAPTAAARPGGTVTIAGHHLDRVDTARLGREPLRLVSQSANELVVELPAAPAARQLTVSNALGLSNSVPIDLRRTVSIRLADDVSLAGGEQLRLRVAGREYRLSSDAPTEVSLLAWQPVVLTFDIVAGDTVRSRGALRTVAWPGQDVAEISADNSLLGRMLKVRHLLPELDGDDWATLRPAAERVLTTTAAQEFADALRRHAAGNGPPPAESLVIAAVDAYRDLPHPTGVDKYVTSAAVKPTTPWGGELDHIIGTTLTSLSAGGQKPADNADEGGYLYPEETAGNDYSQVIILRHVDDNLFSTGFTSFSGCDFSEAEEAYATIRNGSPDERQRLWRSDLCVQVDGVVYVSAAVAKPGFRSAEAVFNEAALGQDPRELMRRHTLPTFLDGSYQWGPGGYYLKADSGLPLCHMEDCYIELLTSGYGLYKNVALTANQQKIVETLRVRMWIEALIPWLLELADVSEEDEANLKSRGIDVAKCLRDDLIARDDLLADAERLGNFLRANRDKTGDELLAVLRQAVDQKLASWARSYAKGELGNSFVNCLDEHVLTFNSLDEMQDIITDKVIAKAGLTTFLTILTFVENLGSAALTPEKFAFRIQPRAEIRNVSPRVIDLYNDNGSLTLDGDWLMDLDPAEGCGGDGWCPSLVVRDSLPGSDREREIQLDESHLTSTPPGCSFACTSLSIPISELDALQDLKSGPVTVELAISDPDYQGHYPGGKLRIPVPGQTLELRTRANIHAVQPPLVKAGETLRVLGNSFDPYGDAAVFELRPRNVPGENIALESSGNNPFPDEERNLRVPAGVAAGIYDVIMKPGVDATGTNLETVESQTALGVSGSDRQWVVVADHGEVKDDAIRVEFLHLNDGVVSYLNPARDMRFDLPTNEQITDVPRNSYVYGLSWDDSDDPSTSSGFAEVTDIVAKVRVTCLVPSADKTCTWGIRSLKDELCQINGATPRSSFSAKVGQGEVRDYHMQPPGLDTCSFVD